MQTFLSVLFSIVLKRLMNLSKKAKKAEGLKSISNYNVKKTRNAKIENRFHFHQNTKGKK